MPSVQELAPRDFVSETDVVFNTVNGRTVVHVVFWPNRITAEPVTIEDPDAQREDALGQTSFRNAQAFCQIIKSWDLTGPIFDRKGTQLVDDDTIVPLEPRIIRMIPASVTNRITEDVVAIARPNES
jgi:hypothetical protein